MQEQTAGRDATCTFSADGQMLTSRIGRDARVEFSSDGHTWHPITSRHAEMSIAPPAPAATWRRERRHTTLRHLRAVRLWRARQIVRSIPTDLPLAQYLQARRYVAKAVSLFGRRQLARIAWPWLPRQKDAGRGHPFPGQARRAALATARDAGTRTPRGRATNPTALP